MDLDPEEFVIQRLCEWTSGALSSKRVTGLVNG